MQPTQNQFTEKAWEAIVQSQDGAKQAQQQQLESEHLLLALLAERGLPREQLEQALITLRASRPTAVNLMNNLDRMKLALAQPHWEIGRAHV